MKTVNVMINGIHNNGNNEDSMQIKTTGTYYNKNGKHYICYEERDKDSGEITGSILKIWGGCVEMVKRGNSATHLYFEKDKLRNTYMHTVMGKLFIGVNTSCIDIIEEEGMISVKIEYALIMEGEKVSDCMVEILVKEADSEQSGQARIISPSLHL